MCYFIYLYLYQGKEKQASLLLDKQKQEGSHRKMLDEAVLFSASLGFSNFYSALNMV